MQLHKKYDRGLSGIHYWGERPIVGLRINFGNFKGGDAFVPELRHYHKTRTTYFCVLEGAMYVEIDGAEIMIDSEHMLEIQPHEVYRVDRIGNDGCIFVVIGSHNEDDRVEVT